MESGETIQVPNIFFKLVGNKQIGDTIQVEVDAQGEIIKIFL